MGLSMRLFPNVGLADEDYSRPTLRLELALHRGEGDRLLVGYLFAGEVPAREEHPEAAEDACYHADLDEDPAVLLVPPREQVEGPEPRHNERPAHHSPAHVVGVLREHPWVEEDRPVVVQLDVAVLQHPVADRVLRPGVGGDDEVARSPRAEEDHQRREPVNPLAETSLSPEEQPHERGLQEEREGALHRQGLGDDVAGERGEGCPVGAELELQGDAGDDAHYEGYGEDLAPEPRRGVVELVAVPHVDALEHED